MGARLFSFIYIPFTVSNQTIFNPQITAVPIVGGNNLPESEYNIGQRFKMTVNYNLTIKRVGEHTAPA